MSQPTLFELGDSRDKVARLAARRKQKPDFAGADYQPGRDRERLTKQVWRVLAVLEDRQWYSVQEISRLAECPENSAQAQVRNLRKPQFGGHKIERRRGPGGPVNMGPGPGGVPKSCVGTSSGIRIISQAEYLARVR